MPLVPPGGRYAYLGRKAKPYCSVLPVKRRGSDSTLHSTVGPLDQEDIATMITDTKLSTVEDYIGAIGSESVRGFHTIELLLFKDGSNRTVRSE